MNNKIIKANLVLPLQDKNLSNKYSLYDYKTKEMKECFDYTTELPIYYLENPETKEPLYFKLIPGYNDCYGITKEGIVISFKTRHINTLTNPKFPLKIKILQPHLLGNKILYKAVGLSHFGVNKIEYIHRLVLETWVGLPFDMNPDGSPLLTPPECNHRDNNPDNNDYTNLEWCDRYYNNSHRIPPEDWDYSHSLQFYLKQQTKLNNKFNDYVEEIYKLEEKEELTHNELQHYNKINKQLESLESTLSELSFIIDCKLDEELYSKEVV